MANAFNMELRGQQEWSWLLAIDLFLGGLGGGLFLLFQAFHLPLFTVFLSLGLVVLGGVVLLSELGRPSRAWRAIVRLRSSWISRGVLFVSVFVVAAALYVAPAFSVFSWLPWNVANPAGRTLSFIAGLSALLITLYPGFVLSASRSIPFWNTPLLPFLFLTQSIVGATGILLLISPFGSFEPVLPQIELLAVFFIAVNFILILVHLLFMKHAGDQSGAAARESVRLLNRGSLGWTFWVGVPFVGMILPLAVILSFRSAMVLAGALILVGALLFRYCVLKAGVYVPSALVGMDMSKLNRADDELAREYASMAARRTQES